MRQNVLRLASVASAAPLGSMRLVAPSALRLQASRPATIRTFMTSPNFRLEMPEYLDAAEKDIFQKLDKALEPTRLEVQDVSGGCGSMYAIEIASPQFKGLTQLKQHRLVQGILGEDIKKWHGLQLRTKIE